MTLMEYTTLAIVQREIGSDGASYTAANDLLSQHITTASRFIDKVTSGGRLDADEYLKSESKTLEMLYSPIVDNMGNMIIWPHKPLITAVTEIQWRSNPALPWSVADITMAEVYGDFVKLWNSGAPQGRITVKISYSGGLATAQSGLPFDIVEAATMIADRMYHEAKSGLTDVVGVADTGILFYQKAIPDNILAKLQPYIRVVPW